MVLLGLGSWTAGVPLVGCASPGPPHAPSLQLPEPVTDLSARRVGDAVELRFTAPTRSTDKLPLRATSLSGVLCRELDHQGCLPVAGFSAQAPVPLIGPDGAANVVIWRDALPEALRLGPPRLLAYRLELFNATGRSAGRSDPAFAVAGAAPATVAGLRAEGSRLGIVLSWNRTAASADPVLLSREDLSPAPAPEPTKPTPTQPAPPRSKSKATVAKPRQRPPANNNLLWLDTHGSASASTLDAAAIPGTPYRYVAYRQRSIPLGGRELQIRSGPSAPVELSLRLIYPPPAPTGLGVIGFLGPAPGAPGDAAMPRPFAADLIWQPVDDTGLLAGLAGYNIYRQPLGASGQPSAAPARLNSALVALPAYHDPTALSTQAYRYTVTAVDRQGNESPPAAAILSPPQP